MLCNLYSARKPSLQVHFPPKSMVGGERHNVVCQSPYRPSACLRTQRYSTMEPSPKLEHGASEVTSDVLFTVINSSPLTKDYKRLYKYVRQFNIEVRHSQATGQNYVIYTKSNRV